MLLDFERIFIKHLLHIEKISNDEQLQLCVVDLNIKCHTILIDVAGWAAPLSGDSWSDGFQETAAWNLTTEEVLDLKELFMIFDSDKDGVLTFTQVKNAIGVLGKPMRGEYHQRVELWLEIDTLAFYSDEELLSLVKKFSEDTKNLSVEFNEFLKMLAYHKNVKSVRSCEELVAAFGSVLSSCTITNNVSEHEQWLEFSNVCIDIDIIHNIRRRHTLE